MDVKLKLKRKMNDLISRFIDLGYKLEFEDNRITVMSKFSGNKLNKESFAEKLRIIFADIKAYDMGKEWYTETLKEATKDIHEYLDKLDVQLGDYDWEIFDVDGKMFNEYQMIEELEDKYPEGLIVRVYDDWYTEKVLEVSEKHLNFNA